MEIKEEIYPYLNSAGQYACPPGGYEMGWPGGILTCLPPVSGAGYVSPQVEPVLIKKMDLCIYKTSYQMVRKGQSSYQMVFRITLFIYDVGGSKVYRIDTGSKIRDFSFIAFNKMMLKIYKRMKDRYGSVMWWTNC